MVKRSGLSSSLLVVAAVGIALTPSVVHGENKANTFKIVGETGASAQQMFLGTERKVYIIDKTENNEARIGDHPTWSVEYDLETNTYRSLDIITNSFCAGGNLMADGKWINVGGNAAVTTGGESSAKEGVKEGSGPYDDFSGGRTIRLIKPSDDGHAKWWEDRDGMPVLRWYPYVENLETGDVIILGGDLHGGFVNDVNSNQNQPSYEFYPSRGKPVPSKFLERTRPANLYALTWLLSDGKLFMQANWQTQILDNHTGEETELPNIPFAQRTYPASAATAMLPLTETNGYKQTILFCGGMNPVNDWDPWNWAIAETSTSNSCVSIQPEDGKDSKYVTEDDLPDVRGMGVFIILPDDRLFLVNGAKKGSAGYGWFPWAVNQSFATDPNYRPAYYDPSAERGKRWDNKGLPESTVARLYHSSATLLPDGSIMVAGSNPNADVITEQNNATYLYKTEYRAEIFYPSYYDAERPEPSGLPDKLSYGGEHFDFTLPASSVKGTNLDWIKIRIIRTGFSTHVMNMGMRSIELRHTWTLHADGSATIHTAQVPPNPALFQPGPAFLFVTIDGIPSHGKMIMVGNGKIGKQPTADRTGLPASVNERDSQTGTPEQPFPPGGNDNHPPAPGNLPTSGGGDHSITAGGDHSTGPVTPDGNTNDVHPNSPPAEEPNRSARTETNSTNVSKQSTSSQSGGTRLAVLEATSVIGCCLLALFSFAIPLL